MKNVTIKCNHIFRSFSNHFNESNMFSERIVGPMLKEEFRVHFRNISAIMDCVGCEKCKLWGKLQVGLFSYSRDLKILYYISKYL